MKRFVIFSIAAAVAFGSLPVTLTPAAGSTTTSGGPAMLALPTVVKSCLNNYTLHAAFDAAQLHALGRPDATPANVNDVPLKLVGSYKYSDHIGCFYKSAKGDIFNLVYNFPCVNPQPANNGDPYAYRCRK